MSDTHKPCPNRETNNKNCTCPETACARHGICCLCVTNHLNKKNLPQCFRQAGIAAQ